MMYVDAVAPLVQSKTLISFCCRVILFSVFSCIILLQVLSISHEVSLVAVRQNNVNAEHMVNVYMVFNLVQSDFAPSRTIRFFPL